MTANDSAELVLYLKALLIPISLRYGGNILP